MSLKRRIIIYILFSNQWIPQYNIGILILLLKTWQYNLELVTNIDVHLDYQVS